jgi:hypothetical protein
MCRDGFVPRHEVAISQKKRTNRIRFQIQYIVVNVKSDVRSHMSYIRPLISDFLISFAEFA